MALELWILLSLGLAGAVVGVVVRLRGKRRQSLQSERNVYPLW